MGGIRKLLLGTFVLLLGGNVAGAGPNVATQMTLDHCASASGYFQNGRASFTVCLQPSGKVNSPAQTPSANLSAWGCGYVQHYSRGVHTGCAYNLPVTALVMDPLMQAARVDVVFKAGGGQFTVSAVMTANAPPVYSPNGTNAGYIDPSYDYAYLQAQEWVYSWRNMDVLSGAVIRSSKVGGGVLTSNIYGNGWQYLEIPYATAYYTG